MSRLVLILLARPSRLTESQLKILADIGVAAGQLTMGVMVLPFIVPGLDKTKLPVIVLGLAATSISWMGAILLGRRIKS